MNGARSGGSATAREVYVSRLRWADPPQGVATDAPLTEVPHIAGVPVAGHIPETATRVREWPNRMGVLEDGRPTDHVLWAPNLAHPGPPTGRRFVRGTEATRDFADRLAWFRTFLKSLSQHRGVTPLVVPDATCSIVLTRGPVPFAIHAMARRFPEAAILVPGRLGEFPGGVQLVLTDTAWDQSEAYAGMVRKLVRGSE